MEPIIAKQPDHERLVNIIGTVLLVLGAITMLFPLFWMLTASLKSSSSIFSVPLEWIPKEFHFENYLEAFGRIAFVQTFFNTIVIAGASTVGQVVSSVLVGYGLARLDFSGKKLWFYCFIGSMMLPAIIGLLPLFSVYRTLGMYNTWWPLILPNFFGAPFYIFMIRQFLMQIPRSYDESAAMDGAGHLLVLRQILFPMIKPVVVIIVIMQVQASWNDYLGPLVYLAKPELWTLSLAVAQFVSNYNIDWNIFMAADVVYILPMLLIFIFGQKYFMDGFGAVSGSGLKF